MLPAGDFAVGLRSDLGSHEGGSKAEHAMYAVAGLGSSKKVGIEAILPIAMQPSSHITVQQLPVYSVSASI